MRLLEADFAQIEHINQILYDNRGYEGWMCFDTHYLIKAYDDLLMKRFPTDSSEREKQRIGVYNASNPGRSYLLKGVTDVRYDSFIVSIEKLTSGNSTIGWRYSFEIRNALWDGAYLITKSKSKPTDASETFAANNVITSRDSANDNNIVFDVMGADTNRVRICFHLNLNASQRNIQTTALVIDNPSEYTHQYDETVCEIGYIKRENGTPVQGATVSIEPTNSHGLPVTKGIKEYSTVTDAKGKFKMCYSAVDSPGHYYVRLKASVGGGAETSKVIHILKTQHQKISITWGDESQYEVYKGSIATFKIPLTIYDELGLKNKKIESKLKNLVFNVSLVKFGGKTDNIVSCRVNEKDGEYYIAPQISFRDYYENTSRLVVELPASAGYGIIKETHLLKHKWYIASDYTDLNKKVLDVMGPDWIFLKGQTYTATGTIEIKRPITIAGIKDTNPCTIDGAGNTIFKINNVDADTDNYMQVNIIGLKLTKGAPAINQHTGSRLIVDSCFFTGNNNDSQHQRGCSIFMPVTDATKKQHNLWKTEVRNCRFHNNRGNEIQSIGETYIITSMFTTTDKNFLQQPEVKVVSVRAGETYYSQNKSYVNIPFTTKRDAMQMNHSYAKALAYIDSGAKFNGKGPANLKGDGTLPLYSSPWNNEAYTRACYYYPYDNVRTHIVCSPRKGRERKATGHASSAKNWVFYDGYYFTRLENSKGNSKNPWSSKELELPTNTGIYNTVSTKFNKGYDPRESGNLSKTPMDSQLKHLKVK